MKMFWKLLIGIIAWSIFASIILIATLMVASIYFDKSVIEISMKKFVVLIILINLFLNFTLIRLNYYE